VIAFRRGALAEIVEHGKTGFLVDSVEEMGDAIGAAGHLDPEACRRDARAIFRPAYGFEVPSALRTTGNRIKNDGAKKPSGYRVRG
jgi:glycosyltransferase involved in cell wall biosynthesis